MTAVIPVVVNVAVRKDNNVLFLRKKKLGCWTLPGGHLERFESIEECAKREVFEETNIRIDHIQVIGFSNDVEKKYDEHHIMIWVEARYARGKIKNKEKSEFSKIWWFNGKSLPEDLFVPIKKFFARQHLFEVSTPQQKEWC